MKHANLTQEFEADINNLLNPPSVIAVVRSIKLLTSGDILKVTSHSKNTIMAIISFCKNSTNTLLQKESIEDEVTLFIKKD